MRNLFLPPAQDDSLADRIFGWMAGHPWSVGVVISVSALFVGLIEKVPGI